MCTTVYLDKDCLFFSVSYFHLIRLCKFSIARIVLTRSIETGDSSAIVIAVKIQVIFIDFILSSLQYVIFFFC